MLFKLLLFSFNLNIRFNLFFTRAKIIYKIEYEFELGWWLEQELATIVSTVKDMYVSFPLIGQKEKERKQLLT